MKHIDRMVWGILGLFALAIFIALVVGVVLGLFWLIHNVFWLAIVIVLVVTAYAIGYGLLE